MGSQKKRELRLADRAVKGTVFRTAGEEIEELIRADLSHRATVSSEAAILLPVMMSSMAPSFPS